MNKVAEDILMHYGMKRRSGRYPWGSGDEPFQRSGDFLARVEELKKNGFTSEKERAEALGMNTKELRLALSAASYERKTLLRDRARSLREDGKSLNEIAAAMGFKNDSSVRALLNESTAANQSRARNTADILRKELAQKHMLDIGTGTERELGVSKPVLEEAVYILENEGYQTYNVGMDQVTNFRKRTIMNVLADQDHDIGYAYKHLEEIDTPSEHHSDDGGDSYTELKYPSSIDGKRVGVRYADQGGLAKDGVIEIRRGVDDLNMGKSTYAQVRVLVDDGGKLGYLKGMAIYSDSLPDGIDIMYNTNKTSDVPRTKTEGYKDSVFKKIEDDPVNPFGASLKANGQSTYTDADGNEKLSPINKLKEESEWNDMAKTLSSQFVSKQPLQFIHQQLDRTYADKMDEYDEIASIINPTLKKKMLLDFAESCDSAAVHMKCAGLPRQSVQVILPVDSIGEKEVYAPNYNDGERVVLIRYPHGGTFEIPELTVNNKNAEAKSTLGITKDAIGISPKTAVQLSGADFDGDMVTVIPVNSHVKIATKPYLNGLKDFDPKIDYAYQPGCKLMSKGMIQKQMGIASNLITDMTLRGATPDEITKAVKHSMVIIDAYKHKLDYTRSEKENDIRMLSEKYQGHVEDDGRMHYGASTLISRRKSTVEVPKRQGQMKIDPETGEVSYKSSGKMRYNKETGKYDLPATDTVYRISQVKDANELSSGTPQEKAYASYVNKMKALGNRARKEYMATGEIKYDASAKETYKAEVAHLMAQLNTALMNSPRERHAQRLANSIIKAKIQDNPELKLKENKKDLMKLKTVALNNSRVAVGASSKKKRIQISDREWDAIQAGAVSPTTLKSILRFADADKLRERATPRTTTQLSPARQNRIQALLACGYTNAQVADAVGCAVSTVNKYSK